MSEEVLVSIDDAAKMLKVSRSQVYVLVQRQKLRKVPLSPVYEKGGRVGIPLADVLALLPEPDRAAALERLK